jgi:predicted amidohydrolase
MRICLAQLDCRLGEPRANAARARETIAAAQADGADLVVFPELWLCGYALHGLEGETATPCSQLAAIAGATGSALLTFREPGGTRTFNSAAYLERGRLLHVHRKLYLVGYPPFDEDRLFAPGERLRAFTTQWCRAAMLICNDAWQPFAPALAAHDGAEVLLLPAASSTAVAEAESYWNELTRFYARMLGCWVVFVNRAGREPGLEFWGGSHVVDPSGEVVAQAPRLEEALLSVEIDVAAATRRRRELHLPGDLRPDLLAAELARLGASRR